ncbi:SWIM zinc finger family protein [Brachybacterium hainanense]|uniref:SWIM-type domain-containing protein n=1 Tax=Brachybacterium hainanense TaxID=1541174 RepID=A0ABV6R796_9MICO
MSITLRSRRGAIGTAWHAAALRTALEQLLGTRTLAAGRRIARAGGVQWLDVSRGEARGDVVGGDGAPRPARISIRPLRPEEHAAVLRIAGGVPGLVLRLAAGEYPEEFEKALGAEDMSLLPVEVRDASFDCSCLDWPGPCEHVSALLYVLVEAVEEDPLLLARLRGIGLEELGGRTAARGAPDPTALREVAAGHGDRQQPAPGTVLPEPEQELGVDESSPEAPAATAPAAGFDPHIADPSLLVEAIGPEAARIIGDFYRAARDEG